MTPWTAALIALLAKLKDGKRPIKIAQINEFFLINPYEADAVYAENLYIGKEYFEMTAAGRI